MSDEQVVEQPDAAAPEEEQPEEQVTEAPDPEALLAEAQAQAAEYLDGWQRARAELINYRKRVERERADWAPLMRAEAIVNLLPILDDLDRAMETLPDNLAGNEWVSGITLIYGKLQAMLKDMGIEEMDALGQVFDPERHEAVMQREDGSSEPDRVIEVLRKGYVMKDRVLRPAMVVVAS